MRPWNITISILCVLLIMLFSLQDCSLFYSKNFCFPCVKKNLKAFPLEIQEDMDKRKPQQKSWKKKTKPPQRIQSINLEGPRETFLWLGFLLSLLGDYHVAPFKEVTFISSPLLEGAAHFPALGLGSNIPVQRQGVASRCWGARREGRPACCHHVECCSQKPNSTDHWNHGQLFTFAILVLLFLTLLQCYEIPK